MPNSELSSLGCWFANAVGTELKHRKELSPEQIPQGACPGLGEGGSRVGLVPSLLLPDRKGSSDHFSKMPVPTRDIKR